MRYRKLVKSGVEVSEICWGSMRFVPPYSPPDQWAEGERALNAAIDGGINFIHSSDEYKTYEATGELLGKHPKRSELQHIIKVESPDYEESTFDKARFRSQVESALKHLHTEHIAVVQHLQRGPNCPKPLAYSAEGDAIRVPGLQEVIGPLEEIVGELQDEGKIGELFSFPHTMGFARAAMESGVYNGIVHFFNMLETEIVELFPEFEQRDMSFISIRPILQGMLTDARINRDQLPADDSKRESRWDQWYELLEEVKKVLGEEPSSWTDYTLQFSLAHPQVTSVVCGLNTEKQVEEALRAVEGDYPSKDVVLAANEARERYGWIPKETIFG